MKRRPELPAESNGILEAVSKADLLEAAWWLAGACCESSDDGAEVRARLLRELNTLREGRGLSKLKLSSTGQPTQASEHAVRKPLPGRKRVRLLWDWSARIGKHYRCVHTGRVGKLVDVRWQDRTTMGGDHGVFLTLDVGDGKTIPARPAFVELVELEGTP